MQNNDNYAHTREDGAKQLLKEHLIGTAAMAQGSAIRQLNESAYLAGLLHDLFVYDWHFCRREIKGYFHGFTHPRAALINARKYFKLNAREENTILRHMWPLTPIPPATAAGFAVTAADKICSLEETLGNFRLWLAFCRLRPAHGVHNIRS